MKRVFICSGRSLFSEGLKNLLADQPDLTVVGWQSDAGEALRSIQVLQPDTLLLVHDGSSSEPLTSASYYVRAGVKAKIVELSLKTNCVYVYQGEERTIKEVSDLVQALE
ncbi:MAG: hypothetical protein WBH90_02935 [Aggregatilineales bacterium]|nr:hypothetical protein [Chloroflexota bacterium]HOA25812.1 hypothetical protein [Aggregatilineales bacterium]HQE19498.1 hypothetical protein [Aggregatilineales bacterium]